MDQSREQDEITWSQRAELASVIEAVLESQAYEYQSLVYDPQSAEDEKTLSGLGRKRWQVTCMCPLTIELHQTAFLVMLRRRVRPVRFLPQMGSQCASAKLNEAQVREIKRLLQVGARTHRELAAQFGVAESTIHHISTGRNWKHVRI